MNTKILAPLIAVSLFAGGAAGVAVLASAQTTNSTSTSTSSQTGWHMGMMGQGVVGTIASVSGNTLTVTGKNGTTYTVDVSNAKITKAASGAAPTTATVADLAVNDMVVVKGTVSGTSVTATAVMDGVFKGGFRGRGPGVMGQVSAINGNTLTVTGKNGTTYTVDASGATVSKTSTVSVGDIKVGDTIGVMGSVTGNSVTAKNILDGLPIKLGTGSQTQTQ
jgi:riboflavin synthase alpha subunit